MAIEISRVQIEAQVVGLAAQTRIELVFRNPNGQPLEGELQFPLLAGQSVTGFALDIDGELRAAVPVDKAKGRQVFEDVSRTRVDPALLETTGGNNYRLRVYPLPPRGTRRVVLDITETLAPAASAARAAATYVLPLNFGAPVKRLDIAVRMGELPRPQMASATLGAQKLPIHRGADGMALLELTRTGYAGRDSLRLEIASEGSKAQVATQIFNDANYFYAEVPAVPKTQARRAPAIVGIVWDASGSGTSRDHDRELAMLDHYFRAVRNVTVDLLVVRDVAASPQRFSVTAGDWRALRETLRAMVYDGATRLDQMAPPPGVDLALLFSDGLGTYGELGLPRSTVPLYAISSSVSADIASLRHAAENSGGVQLDLSRTSAADAANELRNERSRLIGLSGAGATDLVAQGRYPQQGRFVIAGRLTEPRATVTLELQGADGTRSSRTVSVSGNAPDFGRKPLLPVAAHRWAALRLDELSASPEQNRESIRRLGSRFGLVTSGTSLIVLDTVADYARHEIEPPPSLRAAYEQLMARRRTTEQESRQAQIERIVQRFAEKQAWWAKEFPKGELPEPPTGSAGELRITAPVAAMRAPPPPSALAPSPSSAARERSAKRDTAFGRESNESSITLKKWTPDSTYARRLRAASPEEMYAIYLDEKPSYTSSTAFFLDAADIFMERGQSSLALRIMSNLAEMDLENRQILRILAYRLLQANQVKLALPLLTKVLALSPDEPQSYRDLGLALAADGQHQRAVNNLWEVVSRPWNNRFPDIELVALAELNAVQAQVIASGLPALDTAAIDSRLLRNLPLDVRAVLAWDADNTDIDLHVIDPNGEAAFYGRRLTYQGGRMSRDFTGGYGPEEFSLRHAKPGTYTVKAHFYGHRQQMIAPATTVMLRLTTGFGTPAQKDAEIVLRLSGEGQEVTVGTFQVLGSPSASEAVQAQ